MLTSGEDVGLPDGQMGNSEVGHLNIGAGRVLYQDPVKINKAIRENKLKDNMQVIKALLMPKRSTNLFTDRFDWSRRVHALSLHMVALAQIATDMGLDKIFIHGLTDGRDTDPRSAYGFIEKT